MMSSSFEASNLNPFLETTIFLIRECPTAAKLTMCRKTCHNAHEHKL